MKTITAALFATALSGAAFTVSPPALASPGPVQQDKEWCPDQGWDEAWGVNEDWMHCHPVNLNDEDEGLDKDVPDADLGEGLPPTYKDGDYPPDYDWSERYGDNHGGRHG